MYLKFQDKGVNGEQETEKVLKMYSGGEEIVYLQILNSSIGKDSNDSFEVFDDIKQKYNIDKKDIEITNIIIDSLGHGVKFKMYFKKRI